MKNDKYLLPQMTLPLDGDLKQFIEECKAFTVKERDGITFGLIMKTDEYQFYFRPGQPCFGELRKYDDIDPDGYTNPPMKDGGKDTYRPGDLHHPFPDGEPVVVLIPFHSRGEGFIPAVNELFFSEESPWRNGFVHGAVELEPAKQGSFDIALLTMTDTSFDSTVFVNMINNIKSLARQYNASSCYSMKALHDAGAPMKELFAIIQYCQFTPDRPTGKVKLYIHDPDNYYNSNNFDFARYDSGNSQELTGGSFRDRYDYNRNRLQDVFEGDVPLGTKDFLLSQVKNGTLLSVKDAVAFIRSMYQQIRSRDAGKAVVEEKPIRKVRTPRDAMGRFVPKKKAKSSGNLADHAIQQAYANMINQPAGFFHVAPTWTEILGVVPVGAVVLDESEN